MHFSKTYQQLLLSLPEELRDSAIEYRKLKKLINKIVNELNSLGLSPEILQGVLQSGDVSSPRTIRINDHEVKVVYELSHVSNRIEPRIRLIDIDVEDRSTLPEFIYGSPIIQNGNGLVIQESDSAITQVTLESNQDTASLPGAISSPDEEVIELDTHSQEHETIIPLVSDTAFFQVLMQALQCLSVRLAAVRVEFETNLHTLSRSISQVARPASSTSSFRPYSAHSTDPGEVNVQVPPHRLFAGVKSDLYAWREVFQLYVEADIFESHQEISRGERTIEESEKRLDMFTQHLTDRGFVNGREFNLKESRQVLQTFLHLNAFILDLRKFQFATSEATRKILKKHAKRTALPLAPAICSPFLVTNSSMSTLSIIVPASSSNVLTGGSQNSLSLLLGQAIGEHLLPIIPHIDDYACLICTNIAFKPIRLACGHLFCVRCLVKMQKRGQGHCPMCRSPTVLSADRSNVDWALLNFMTDWFPVESRKKLRQNEKEVAEEEWEELGFEVGGCTVM